MSPHSDGICPKQCSVSEVAHVHKGNPVVIMLENEPHPRHSLDICFCSFLCPDFLLYKINSSYGVSGPIELEQSMTSEYLLYLL